MPERLNILLASSIATWGGGENWMLSTAVGLRERGHKVILAGRPGAELLRRAREQDLPTRDMNYRGDFDPATFWRFWRLCRRAEIDVLCTNMQRVLRIAGPAARAAGVRAVVPRVGSQAPLGSKLSHVWAWKQVAAGIIANSRATRETLLESAPWLSPEKVRVIYNGIHPERYGDVEARAGIRAELDTPPDAPVIGMIGELTERKNHILVLRCLPRLVERFPALRLWIVGDGDQRDILRAEADRLGVADRLVLTGFRSDVPDVLAGIDVLAHPALMEGFGYVLVEAMAAGKAVVAADTSNLPEIVAEGETGYLCSPADAVSWGRRLEGVLGDRELARRLGEAGQVRAKERFSFGRMLGELEEYFVELVG